MKHRRSYVQDAGQAASGTEGIGYQWSIFPAKSTRLRQVREWYNLEAAVVQSKGGGPVFGLPSVRGPGNLSVLGGRDVGTSWRYGNRVRGEVDGGDASFLFFLL